MKRLLRKALPDTCLLVAIFAAAWFIAARPALALTWDKAPGVTGEAPHERVVTGIEPMTAAISHDGRVLYVANACGSTPGVCDIGGSLSAFSIADQLRPAPRGKPVAVSGSPMVLQIASDGRYVYVGSCYWDDTCSVGGYLLTYALGSDGRLAPVDGWQVKTADAPVAIVLDSGHDRLYLLTVSSCIGSGNECIQLAHVLTFNLRKDGRAVRTGKSFEVMQAASALALDPSGRHLYVVGGSMYKGTGNGDLWVVDIEADGSLHVSKGGKVDANVLPVAVAVDRGGHYLYVASQCDQMGDGFDCGGGAISRYSLAANGQPTWLANVSVSSNVSKIRIGPQGHRLFSIEGDSLTRGTLTAWSLDDHSLVKTGSASTGIGPSAIAVNATGTHVYVTDRQENTVMTYGVSADGSLNLIAGSSP